MENLSFYSAFFAGILSFLSPCVLPLLPGYISFISGESIESLTNAESRTPRLKAFLGALFFGLGFTLVFVILGASATGIGQFLNEYKDILGRVAGIVVIILGLHMMGIFKIQKLLSHKKWNYKKRNKGPFYIEAFLLGIAFVFGWTPCIGPILGGILALASQEATVAKGMFLLFTYSMGLWIPFLISALALGFVIGGIKKAGNVMVIVEKVAGALLILIGLLMLTDFMTIIVSYMTRWLPFFVSF